MNHRPEEVRKVAKAICQVVTGGDCVMQERDRAPCTDQICRIMPIARDALARAAPRLDDITVRLSRHPGAHSIIEEAKSEFGQLRARIERLEAENEHLRDSMMELAVQVRQLTEQIELHEIAALSLEAALSEYADEANWRLNGKFDPNSPWFQGRAVAKAALASQRT